MSIELAYKALTAFALFVLTGLALACLVRCVLGPRISDRILAINITGTLTVIMVCATVVLLSEGYLADIALIYSMISFLAVIILSKVYTGIYYERKQEEALHAKKAAEENEAAAEEPKEETTEEMTEETEAPADGEAADMDKEAGV